MTARVLLIEPYGALADILAIYLEGLGYLVTLAESKTLTPDVFTGGNYSVVFINLDQGSAAWALAGIKIAEQANAAGLPVVMIPDSESAADVLKQSRFVYLKKPFNLSTLDEAISTSIAHTPLPRFAAN